MLAREVQARDDGEPSAKPSAQTSHCVWKVMVFLPPKSVQMDLPLSWASL